MSIWTSSPCSPHVTRPPFCAFLSDPHPAPKCATSSITPRQSHFFLFPLTKLSLWTHLGHQSLTIQGPSSLCALLKGLWHLKTHSSYAWTRVHCPLGTITQMQDTSFCKRKELYCKAAEQGDRRLAKSIFLFISRRGFLRHLGSGLGWGLFRAWWSGRVRKFLLRFLHPTVISTSSDPCDSYVLFFSR